MINKIAILDAGAQYAKLIDRRVRELNVESEILPLNTSTKILKNYQALIISGGPESVYSPRAPKYSSDLFDLNIPILGICYGMQLMNYAMGGKVAKKERREDGPCKITINTQSILFHGLAKKQNVLMAHGDSVDQLAEGFVQIADSSGIVAAIENTKKSFYGVQFHPEVDLTIHGRDILANFLFKIAKLKADFTIQDRLVKAIADVKQKVGDKKVLILVSGGVDSTVCAALLTKALKPNQIYALHVDTGFMRRQESQQVKKVLIKMGLNLKVINAANDFYHATTLINNQITPPLNKVIDPQVKRQIIGDTFIKISKREIIKLGLKTDETFLVQGTLRPDLIESASNSITTKAAVIKTHHNDTNLVRALRDLGRVIEPLAEYHKDEVRKLAIKLNLSDEIVWRQPFPGPGLAIRILCANEPYLTKDFNDINQKLAEFSTKEVTATLLPVRTVGVQGDGRTFSYLVGLSGGKKKINDSLFWQQLFSLAREIPKYIHQANRVVYIFGEPIVGQVTKITPTLLEPTVIAQLQQADEIVNQVLLKDKLLRTLSQVPVVSFPIYFGKHGYRSIGIRTFITNDFMTGVPAMPGREMPFASLQEIVSRILSEVPKIARVVYDLTSKPPGTTEWE